MTFNEIIELLHPELRKIVEHELNLGNKIFEISSGWGGPTSILVILEFPFKKSYAITNIEHLEVNDPHYWKSEYHYAALKQSIACKF